MIPSPFVRALAALSLCAGPALSQVVNPADKAKGQDTAQVPQSQLPPPEPPRLKSYEMPPTVVTEERMSELREEDLIGSYNQPRWTATRRFPSTRIYVVPEGKLEFEWWTRIKVPRHGGDVEMQNQYEFEVGLPYRFQLDVYAVSNQVIDVEGPDFNEQKIEIRWAFADWGGIWGNPTAYVEWDQKSDEADVMEYKLLLGGEVTTGWHWGSNLVFEHQMGDSFENVYELTGGLSKTIVDEKFSLGGEFKLEFSDEQGNRGDYNESLEIGPSLQWRPSPGLTIDFAPLFGIGGGSRAADIFFVLGWEF